MKQTLHALRGLLLLAILVFGQSISAEEFTFDFMSAVPEAWTSNPAPFGFESTSRGCQYTSNATLTLKGAKNVTKVVITCSSNVAGKNTIALNVGGKAFGSTVTMAKETNVEKTFSGSAASGDIALAITRSEKSVYISKIVVTADAIDGAGGGGGNGGNGGGGDQGNLDPNYNYAEPTIVTVAGETGISNTSYSFIQNNIKVETTTGAKQESYFGCNAGNEITFTATKDIKAVVINGFVKKDFSATASSGNIGYVDASEEDVTADPVVAVLDVNSKSLTISCEKQMRCYNVEFYFVENPDIEISGDDDDDDGDLTFDWEPDETTTLNITFDEAQAVNYTGEVGYNYTAVLLSSEDYEMEMAIFAPTVEGTIVAPGTYTISDTYAEGTVQASPGGDDWYDYPTFIATDYEYDEEYDEWYYTTAYYLVSGTVTVAAEAKGVKLTIDAKTSKGSTVKATYTGAADIDTIDVIESEAKSSKTYKQLENGHIVIVRAGNRYGIDGVRR